MKKIYQAPETALVRVALTQMIASSPLLMNSGYNAASENLSRRGRNDWDDEEDYE